MGEHFNGTRGTNLPLISYVTRRLVNGHKNEFTNKIGYELDVKLTAKNSTVPLIGIKGNEANVKIAEGVLRELDQKAQIIADRNGLKTTSDVRPEHWSHIEVDLKNLLGPAKEALKRESGMKSVLSSTSALTSEKPVVPSVNDNPNPAREQFFDSSAQPKTATATSAAFSDASKPAGPSPAVKKITKRLPAKVSAEFAPRNQSQAITYVAALDTAPAENDGNRPRFVNSFLFAGGPAGGGKTYAALSAAWDAYQGGLVDEIIIIRPPTTAGKDPGAMPGDMKKKSAPYLAGGIASNLEKITGYMMKDLEDRKVIRAILPDWERGETYGTEESPALVVIDEPQNLTLQQAELLITRPGKGSLMIWCGDIGGKQNDLKNQVPGLAHLIATQGSGKMSNTALDKAAAFIKFTEEDSDARNPILPHVLKALNSPPDDYAALMKTFNAVGVNAKVADSIEAIRLYAVDILDKTSEMTLKQYDKKLKSAYPALFPSTGANVMPFKPAARQLQSS